MSKKLKWKPGQIVTIASKRYRIRRCPADTLLACIACCAAASRRLLCEPCTTCRSSKMPGDCYPQEITQ